MADDTETKRIKYIDGHSFWVIPSRVYGDMGAIDLRKFVPDERVHFAMAIIEKHALITAAYDGEDSAGRAKMKQRPAKDIVAMACDISEQAFAEFEARGWRQPMPTPDELEAMARENKSRN